MGTEIHTFTSLKDLTEYIAIQTSQYKSLFEDYSQWLGTVLRDAETSHKNEDWYQKSAALQKTLKAQSKKPVNTDKSKKGGKGGKDKEEASPLDSIWRHINFIHRARSNRNFIFSNRKNQR